MDTLDWQERATRVDAIGRKPRGGTASDRTVVYATVGALSQEMHRILTRLAAAEETLHTLTRQIAALESRIHEEVE